MGGGAQVQYGEEGAVLMVPAGGPAQAIIYDAAGRSVGTLELTEGRNRLPVNRPGVYLIRFPFQPSGLKYLVR